MLAAFSERVQARISRWFGDEALLDSPGIPGFDAPLIDLLPYRAFEPDSGVYVNESSCGFLLETAPLSGASEETLRHLTAAFSDTLPNHASLQILLWASPRIWNPLAPWQAAREHSPVVYKDMADRRMGYFREAGWTSPLAGTAHLLRDFRVFVAGSLPGEIARQRAVLTTLKRNVKAALENMGLPVMTAGPDDFLSILDEWLHPSPASARSERRWRNHGLTSHGLDPLSTHPASGTLDPLSTLDPLHHQLAGGSLQVLPDRLILNEAYDVRCLGVQSYPEVWAGWQNGQLIGAPASDAQRIPCPFLIAFSLSVGTETADAARAGLKSTRATHKAGTGLARFMPTIQEVASEWKYVAEKIREGHKLARCFYQVIVFAQRGTGEEAEQAVRSLYRGNGWRLTRDRYVQLQSFLAALPFFPAEGMTAELAKLGRTRTLLTWSCANLAPVMAEWKGMASPLMLLIGRRGQPFCWDPFANDEGNYNVAVIGKSGSGKSVFMQELVASIAGSGGQVIVIDDGYSFMNSCRLQGGDFVAFSGDSAMCLNPFSMIEETAFASDGEYREGVISMISALAGQMARTRGDLNDLETAHIERAVIRAWEEKGPQAEIHDVGLLLQENSDPRIADLGQMMGPHMKGGVYERYWNGTCTLAVNAHLTVFELSEIKTRKELQGLVLMVLTFLASNGLYHGDRTRKKALVIDEAWDLLHGPASKLFIEGLARRARKYNGALITGTQSVNDYYKNDAALAAFENTDWLCFLAQKADSITHLKNAGRLSVDEAMERDMASLRMVDGQFSEAMIHGPRGYAIGRLMLDPFSIQLFSSKASDFETIRALQEQGLGLIEAVEQAAGARP